MVELADTGGLNPPGSKEPCGFKSRPGHQLQLLRVEFELKLTGLSQEI